VCLEAALHQPQALVLENLADVADLARCALVAASWHDTVRAGLWPRARGMRVRSQGDGAPAAIAWAAQRCGNIAEVLQCRSYVARLLFGSLPLLLAGLCCRRLSIISRM
jgi:hypothetical protein